LKTEVANGKAVLAVELLLKEAEADKAAGTAARATASTDAGRTGTATATARASRLFIGPTKKNTTAAVDDLVIRNRTYLAVKN
jgi:hypothetical protein